MNPRRVAPKKTKLYRWVYQDRARYFVAYAKTQKDAYEVFHKVCPNTDYLRIRKESDIEASAQISIFDPKGWFTA